MEFVKSQQADRERMVCAVGLDVHYELNVLSGETGSYQPRLRPFNPRMSGPACPYNYTGKFLGEASINDVCDDPIELGRKIHAEPPYDTALYRKHDPRKVSKTVVIRDYGCKVPITLADTEHIARAVLNNYPDRYVDFLKEFVSNLMGEAMKKYLITYRDSLNRILENPTELNRVSWGAYKNVQGGHSPILKASNKDLTAEQVYSVDATLPWEDNMAQMLMDVVRSKGDTTTGSLTASDVFDMRPCLQQHIATLDDMSSLWCQGFATKERYALAMIWWCNEQGRNLSQDLALLKDSGHPNYNLIELHVPVNPFHMRDPTGTPKDPSPDQNCAIRANLTDRPRDIPTKYKMQETVAFRVPVGQWTGNNETPNVILNSSKSRFSWGWGHPANLTVNVPLTVNDPLTATTALNTKDNVTMCAPYLRYVFTDPNVKGRPIQQEKYTQGEFRVYEQYPCSKEYVRSHRWGAAFAGTHANDAGGDPEEPSQVQGPSNEAVVEPARRRTNRKLRESLGADDDDVRSMSSFYRGTSSDRTYGALLPITKTNGAQWLIMQQGDDVSNLKAGNVSQETCNTAERVAPVIDNDSAVCDPDGVSIVRRSFSGACRHLDPFFTNGPNCLVTTVNDKIPDDRVINVLIKSRCFSYYNISEIGKKDIFRSTMATILSNVRKFASKSGITNVATSDVGSYMNSYINAGGNYPFRTVVPPLAVLGSHEGSILPFTEIYTSGAEQRRAFDANFNNGNELERRDEYGNLTMEGAKHVVINQPFIPSFCIDMNNVDWKRTDNGGPGNKGYTDLVMTDIKTDTQAQYMKHAMRIITVRTVLSVILGMDTAALICEEPIPSNRLVTWIAGLPLPFDDAFDSDAKAFNDFACSPIIVSGACNDTIVKNEKFIQSRLPDAKNIDVATDHPNIFNQYYTFMPSIKPHLRNDIGSGISDAPPHFTQRILPFAPDDESSDSRGIMDSWDHAIWRLQYDCKIEDRNVVFRKKNDSIPLPNDITQNVITYAMVVVIMKRLNLFLKLVRGEMDAGKHSQSTQPIDLHEKLVISNRINELHDMTRSHMLRMAIISRFASPTHVDFLTKTRQTFDENDPKYVTSTRYANGISNIANPLRTVSNGTTFLTKDTIEDGYSTYAALHEMSSVEYHANVFNSMNCAVPVDPNLNSPENNPETDNFPYDVAFHGHIGGFSMHKLVQPITKIKSDDLDADMSPETSPFYALRVPSDDRHLSANNFPQLRMIESLLRDPRAFYAFNPSEWKAQCANQMKEFGEDILADFATLEPALFTLPYFKTLSRPKDGKDESLSQFDRGFFTKNKVKTVGDAGCIPQASAPALLLAQYSRTSTKPTLLKDNLTYGGRPVGDEFKKASQKYIRALVTHAARALETRSHYLPVIESLGVVPPSSAAYPDPILRGTDGEERTHGSSTGRAPPHSNKTVPGNITGVPSVTLKPVGKNVFKESTIAYFPIHPAGLFTTFNIPDNKVMQIDDRAKLPLAGATTLGTGQGDSKNDDTNPRFSLIPVGNNPHYTTFNDVAKNNEGMTYNVDCTRPQMFAMLDAAGLLWHAREYTNPSDCNRPTVTEAGQCDGMHYWCRTLVETFVSSREIYREREASSIWEIDVKKHPGSALPSSLIGNMCDDTWSSYFPLLPFDHELREDLRRSRALSVLWGTLPTYSAGQDASGTTGAWMPLAPAHQMRLYGTVGLFDGKHRVPKNPWLPSNGAGISLVFNQSYHSVYHCDSYRAEHFQDWLLSANRYQVPVIHTEGCSYPFSQYGGTPVEADFIPHIVERNTNPSNYRRHRQLVYNRFGFTNPLRIGNQYHDTGLLQDMFQYKYRPFADISSKQRQMPEATTVHISNFMSYARTHAIIALASCNHGTEDESVPRIVRNLYRLYVDTYECMGSNTDDDSIPCIMGFSPAPINKREDRGVVLYAGSLACLNSKLANFCSSPMNRGERICAIYKQVYLNDATLLYTRLLRQERRKILHDNNFNRARMKRGRDYNRHEFDRDLVDLQDAYIEFLQNTVLGMLLEGGADLQGAPLHLLEPRELEVSLFQEDDNLVGNDFLTPRTKEIISQSDFGGDNLTRSQLAILSLIPPNHRVLGTLRLNQSMEVVDLEHAKKQIQKETMESNKKVWQRYSEGLISAAFAQKLLEVDGPIDFSLDMSSIQDPMRMRFDMGAFKDPLKESENIKTRMTTTHAQSSSSLSLAQRGEKLRKSVASDSVLNMTTKELNRALSLVRERIERDYTAHGGSRRRIQILEMLRIPAHVRRILRPEYEGDTA
jgi:hypothetical protein